MTALFGLAAMGRIANVGEPAHLRPTSAKHGCFSLPAPVPTFCLFVYNFNGILTGKNIEFFGQSHIIK